MDTPRLARVTFENIAAPLGRRLGTAFAAYLIAKGIPQDMADQVLTAGGVVLGLAIDLLTAYYTNRKRG